MAAVSSKPPEQGQLVTVRQRQFVVTDVARSMLPAGSIGQVSGVPQHLVSLSSVEDDALGEELHVLWELEPGCQVIERVALPEPTGLDDPERLDAFLDAVRWGAASTADVRNVQSPFRSGIDIEDYQLDPVVRAIQMPRANLLIADDVGLGKTIEAGMVILELIIRHRARRVLVICPAALQVQWKEQMRDKFGLDFRIVDTALMKRLRRERGIHVNPWSHFPRLITSIDFLKRDRPLRLLRETLPAEGESLYPRRYDILVVDEAHNCAPSGRGKYATDSLRTQALRLLAPHFEHKLFLTATPHNGYNESFSALLELLDSQRFARGTNPDRRQLDVAMVRRMKSELPPKFDGSPRFPKRQLEALEVDYSPGEIAVHAALRDYSKLRQQRLGGNAERFATEFVLKTLKKRLFSSPAAFATTLAQHERSLLSATRKAAAAGRAFRILRQQVDRVDEDYADDEQFEEATNDAVDASTRLFRELTTEEATLLGEMKEWAAAASVQPDTKAKVLIRWLQENIRPGGKWADERVIIFTEYRATQKWLQETLAREGFGGERLLTLYGGMDTEHRERIKAAFQANPRQSQVRILLATDAASEGIDLQNHCSKLIHWEITWNPNRMEQRNGRIDRHGQRAKEVAIYHFVGKGYKERANSGVEIPAGELEGDLEFLMRAALKINTIREDLGKLYGPDNVVTIKGGPLDDKIEAVERFWEPEGARFLVSTSAGGEGINLQVCRVLFNYDLPWNPMAVEQRIGRVHRYGQQDTVQVYSLIAEDTVEQHIYDLLDEKLLDIARTIGKVDPASGAVVEDFRSEILGFLGSAPNYQELYRKAILDRDYRRTAAELEGMLKTAAVASQALRSLAQDLTAFNLESYRQLQGELTLGDLAVFVEKAILRLGGTCIPEGDFYRIETPQALRAYRNVAARYDTACFRRDVAMRRKNAEFMGIGHPLVDALISHLSGGSWPGEVAALRPEGTPSFVSVRYVIEATMEDGSTRKRYESVQIGSDGSWRMASAKNDVRALAHNPRPLPAALALHVEAIRIRVQSAIADAESRFRAEHAGVQSVRSRVVGLASSHSTIDRPS